MGQTLGSIQSSPFKDTFTDADSGTAMTVREMIESFRGDTIFLDRRKEWGQATKSGLNQAALAEQQAQQQSQAAGQVQPPINPPPVAPL